MPVINASTLRIVVITTVIAAISLVVGSLGLVLTGVNPSEILMPKESDEVTEQHVRDFCGACHAVPRADILPRRSWPEEIEKAYDRYRVSGRRDLKVPYQSTITKYFTRRAPEELNIPGALESAPSPISFRSEVHELPENFKSAAVSFLNSVNSPSAPAGGAADLLLCDMGNGTVNRFAWHQGQMSSSLLATLHHPDHIVPCDFDRDGNQDFLVADLGMLKPTDDLLGSVTLLRSAGQGEPFEELTILDQVGRVADSELADLDGDGDLDFVVAEFGYEKAGRLVWLETLTITQGRPTTRLHVIDSRHGPIHALPTDLDGDGDLDLVVIFGQEYEMIVAYLNDGHGEFESRTLF